MSEMSPLKEAIELAINEGGYDKLRYVSEDRVLLDPLFFQALGKALGWGEMSIPREIYSNTTEKIWAYKLTEVWFYHWYRFIDSLAEGKSPDSFFQDLIHKR